MQAIEAAPKLRAPPWDPYLPGMTVDNSSQQHLPLIIPDNGRPQQGHTTLDFTCARREPQEPLLVRAATDFTGVADDCFLACGSTDRKR